MKPEILAKIMGIIAKTGDRVIVVDAASGASFALMNIDEYERLVMRPSSTLSIVKPPELAPVYPPSLTENKGPGMIDPDLALWKETHNTASGDWGGNESVEEDRYYMEPTE